MPQPAATRLSRDVNALLSELARRPGPLDFDCDLLIVGSGYGGAVAAARLAGHLERDGQPARIWLLERGAEHQPGDFPSRFAELPGFVRLGVGARPRGRRQGLLDLRLDGDVSVLLGNGLGGGSLINANVMLKPEDALFTQGWPAAVTAATMAQPYREADQMLRPAVLPQGRTLRKLTLLGRLGPQPLERAPLTVAWENGGVSAAGVELHACTECGDCLTGCNQGAKGSLDTSYLALARQRQVQIFCGAAALRLEALDAPDGSAGWRLHWRPTEADDSAAAPPPLRARRVLLAAGSLGSTEILLRSAGRGLALSTRLGQGFSMNGDAIAAGLGHAEATGTVADPESDPGPGSADPLKFSGRRVGPTITGLKRVPPSEHGPGFVIEEFAVPAALRRVFGEIVATLGALRGVRLPGDDPCLCSDAHIERMSLYGLMGDDGAQGRLELPVADAGSAGGIEGSLRVSWPEIRRLPLFQAMNEWLAQVFAPGPMSAPPPSCLSLLPQALRLWPMVSQLLRRALGKFLDGLQDSPPKPGLSDQLLEQALGSKPARQLDGADFLPLVDDLLGLAITVHPLGGCRMADSVQEGVVNAAGQVWRGDGSGQTYQGLAVLDGAIVPRALGLNPALTITALAERALPELRRAWGLRQPATQPPIGAWARPAGARRGLPPADTQWGLRERLQGRLNWRTASGIKRYWARMDLVFEEIPGFERALQLPERVLRLRHGQLVLQAFPDRTAAPDEYYEPEAKDPKIPPLLSVRLDGSLRLFMPLAQDREAGAPVPARVTLDYRLSVQGRWAEPGLPPELLRVGSALFGRKTFGLPPATRHDEWPSWMRQLSELEVRIDGQDVGRWALDQGHLAETRNSLLDIRRQSSQPDALLDALVGGGYVLRQLLPQLLTALEDALMPPQALHLNERRPGPVDGCEPQRIDLGDAGGPRLYRYASAGAAAGRPVLLIHGMGAAGSSYSHASLAVEAPNLVQTLRRAKREVWLLELRSSIANEAGRRDAASQTWSAESIALSDIPAAFRRMLQDHPGGQFDVFGHCQGALMLWMALLDERLALGPHVHAAVFSQVGPWLRMSDSNRLRGFALGGLLDYLPLRDLDPYPDFFWEQRDAQGLPVWQQRRPRPLALTLVDTLLGGYPYPDPGQEARRAQQMHSWHWRMARHRADAIFGQLFELDQLSDAALEHLDALLGWAKLNMLEQAVYFARLGMITDVEGSNRWLAPGNLRARLRFPVLMLHGRRNRVFDWQGSERSLGLLKQLAYGEDWVPPQEVAPGVWHYGPDSAAQLIVFDRYGHFDCVIGRHAGREVFPHVLNFFNRAQAPAAPGPDLPPLAPRTPFIGPALGWLRRRHDERGHEWLGLRLLLQPKSREPRPAAVLLVPVDWTGGRPLPRLDQLLYFGWQGQPAPQPHHLDLWRRLDPPTLSEGGAVRSYALLFVESPPPAAQACSIEWRLADPPQAGPDAAEPLQLVLTPLPPSAAEALERLLQDRSALQDCSFHLHPGLLDAADRAAPPAQPPALRFALASCQFPPGLLDEEPAQAGFSALLEACTREAQPPQFLLLAGDQVYLDADAGLFAEPTRQRRHGVLREHRLIYERSWRLPARRRCLTRLPCYPMLDDHEVRDNWGGLGHPTPYSAGDALQAYQVYQHNLAPQPGLSASGSYAYRFAPGGLPFFMLDSRSRRTARPGGEPGEAQLIPDADMDALEAGLLAAPAELPKFILSAAPLLPPSKAWRLPGHERALNEGWSDFPASAARLLNFIRSHNIRQVVLLAGDSHLSSVGRLRFEPDDAGPQIISIVSSGLYTPWPFANQRPEELVLDAAEALDMGTPASPCLVRYHPELTSTRAGFALVQWLPGTAAKLHIELHSPDALKLYCDIALP